MTEHVNGYDLDVGRSIQSAVCKKCGESFYTMDYFHAIACQECIKKSPDKAAEIVRSVFIVKESDGCQDCHHAVFSTKELAESYAKKLRYDFDYDEDDGSIFVDDYILDPVN